MNDAMKALDRLYQKANPSGGDDECRDDYVAIHEDLEAKAEPYAWQNSVTGNFTRAVVRARKWGKDAVPLYTAPPSTAEVRAQALEAFAYELMHEAIDTSAKKVGWSDSTAKWLDFFAARLRKQAKRIREEG